MPFSITYTQRDRTEKHKTNFLRLQQLVHKIAKHSDRQTEKNTAKVMRRTENNHHNNTRRAKDP